VDVDADLLGAAVILDQRAEHGLDRCGLVLGRLGSGLVHDQLASDRGRVGDVLGANLEPGWSAL
jgi:hypothetical protein